MKTDWDEIGFIIVFYRDNHCIYSRQGRRRNHQDLCRQSSEVNQADNEKETKGLTINRKKFERYTREFLSLKLVIASWIPRVMSDRGTRPRFSISNVVITGAHRLIFSRRSSKAEPVAYIKGSLKIFVIERRRLACPSPALYMPTE